MNRLSLTSLSTNRFAMWVVCGALLSCFPACEHAEEPARTAVPGDRAERIPEQQFFGYRLIETQSGVRQWVLDSKKSLKYSGEKDIHLVTLQMDFFQDGEHFSVLTADSGLANPNTKDIHTWGNVVVVTDDERRLETEELFFNNKTQLITNDVFNRFTRDGDVITGIGLETRPDLKYIEIKQKMEAEVEDEADAESGSR